MKPYSLVLRSFLLSLLMIKSSWALTPQVQDITVTDVTPISFSVVWASDQPAICDLVVFSDENGTDDISSAVVITDHPTANGDPAVATAARNRGVMKVRVTSLTPSTTYYFRTLTTAIAGAEETSSPSAGPYPPVTTAAAIAKTTEIGLDEVPFTNDLIYQDIYQIDGTTPAEGALLLASVEGGRYPLSGFVGDLMASPQAAIDLNNLYSTSSGVNLVVRGGQKLILTTFYGINDPMDSAFVMPRNQDLLTARLPIGLADAILILQAMSLPVAGPDLSSIADISQDDRIGLQESVHILQIVAQVQ